MNSSSHSKCLIEVWTIGYPPKNVYMLGITINYNVSFFLD